MIRLHSILSEISAPTNKLDKLYFNLIEHKKTKELNQLIIDTAHKRGYNIGPVFHGSPKSFSEFDDTTTGKGTDQLGSGFYFTTDKSEAKGYTSLRESTKPMVVSAFLNIKSPIEVHGSNLLDVNIKLTKNNIINIIKLAPNIMHPEESPLGDWFEEYWSTGPTQHMISNVADNYISAGLLALENDWFRNDVSAFRKALHTVLKKDGIIKKHSSKRIHYVCWFPNQIKMSNIKTYDNSKQIIPLSQRFDSTKNDFRY